MIDNHLKTKFLLTALEILAILERVESKIATKTTTANLTNRGGQLGAMNSQSEQSLSPLQKALVALKEARAKLETYERASKEPIAIIGMGCRFPGGASNPEAFWDLLAGGKDAIAPIPTDRWSLEDYYDPNPEKPGKMYASEGGFINQLQEFDPQFFGISVRETLFLDPQQRLLLEVSWEALENAGKNPQNLAETKTGVFIGICSNDYLQHVSRLGPDIIDAYVATGNTHSTASGRISYILGLTGPSFSVNTACSSSLVSTHLACTSLRNRESDLAIAGGVNRLMSPELSINFSKAGMLSADSRCKTFDSAADGFVRSEGCGIIILKRLSEAIADGDNILAVIRGTAINQDGHTSGLTVPSGPSQQSVIRQALENSGISSASISYIEAHGTGTSLGDPIEIGALGAVFGSTHSPENPLIVGSVKTNIGHLEGAAGIAGLMKVILQFQQQKIAPHLHFHQPNPYINWSQIPIQVPTQLTPWESNGEPRVAGVSSFGFSGTNAHVILEEAPGGGFPKPAPTKAESEQGLEREVYLLTLSGKTEKALSELVNRYQQYLAAHPDLKLADICYTANTGRAHFNHRLAIIATKPEELLTKLRKQQTGEDVTGVFCGQQDNSNASTSKIAFLFTGQGSQYINMGRQLYQQAPVFREILDECDAILRSELERPLLEVLYPETSNESSSSAINQTAYTQPALFAIEYALFKLWESWGIKPDAVMGHSVGEYVAATVAGLFSLADGLKLIAARGRLMQQLPPGGKMLSAMTSEEHLRSLMASDTEKVDIAAINGPESTVVSGEAEAIEAISSQLEAAGINTKELQVSHAFHSRLMEPIMTEFAGIGEGVSYHQPQITLISNVTGERADSQIASANYWTSHIRQPVRFYQSMKTLHELGYQTFLEIGPKPILTGMGRECLVGTKTKKQWLTSLRPGKPDWLQLLQSLGQLYIQGVKVDWLGFEKDCTSQKIALPTYPWQWQRYWITDIEKYKQKTSQPTEVKPRVTSETETPKPGKIALSDLKSIPKSQTSKQEPIRKQQLLPLTAKPPQTDKIKLQSTAPVNQTPTPTASPSSSSNVEISQVKETLKQTLAQALYVDINEIVENQKFIDLGLDSIVGVEWIATVNQTYGLEIKATKLYDYPTLLELTEHVAQVLSSQGKTGILDRQKLTTAVEIDRPEQRLESTVSSQANILEIQQVLKKQLASALYVDIDEIVDNQKFIDLGLDSIVGVEWIATVNQTYGLEIKATKLYDYPTLEDLTAYVAREIEQIKGTLLPEKTAPVDRISAEANRDIHHSQDSELDVRKQLRSILDKVARNELTIQAANQMIQKLKN